MATTNNEATPRDIENIKKALVGANILRGENPTAEEEAKLNAELARHGIDAVKLGVKLYCSRAHFCVLIKK
jgi:hypothetical protein